MADVRFQIAPYEFEEARALAETLGCSHTLAQVLVRRGLSDPAAASAFLAAETRHPLEDFGGLRAAAGQILAHIERGSLITVHGDYDVDGVTSTAILVRVLRTLGARLDWHLPARQEDGYGLAAQTVDRLAARGTGLLVTSDCGITACAEVARARAAGLDVLICDHHSPRADGVLPDAPIVHPRLGANPCPDLCAAGVAYKLAGALLAAAGLDPRLADEDLDLVALGTVADVVPLIDENRGLVRAGLRALAATRKPGLRALFEVSKLDPSALDATAIAFRLAPRLNAAGRVARADAALDLLLTTDPDTAKAVAGELDELNLRRRATEERIRFAAEAQVREQGERPAYVLAGDGWHPGVIGIVAARIAERTLRPCVMIALEGESGTGSGRSIPAFDLLAGLEAGKDHLLRHGGHRAAAGCTIARADVDAFRATFEAHAAAVLSPEDRVPVETVDAVVGGEVLGLELVEELARLEPFGSANPPVTLLVPGATVAAPQALSEGKHVAFSLRSGGMRTRAVRFGAGASLPYGPDQAVDVAVRLGADHFNGTVKPRVVVRQICNPSGPGTRALGEGNLQAALARELDAPLEAWSKPRSAAALLATPGSANRSHRDVRGSGIGGVIGDLVATGDSVLVVCAHDRARAQALGPRLGGTDVVAWEPLLADPELAAPYIHVVALDPPPLEAMLRTLERLPGNGCTHLVWGPAELGFARTVHAWTYAQGEALPGVYRALRAAAAAGGDGGLAGDALLASLRPEAQRPRTAAMAGRLLRVLEELELVRVERHPELRVHVVEAPVRTKLDRSEAFVAYERRRAEGFRWLTQKLRAA